MATKVRQKNGSNNTLDSIPTVNLSYSAYAHRFSNEEKAGIVDRNTVHFISEKTYINGEITVCKGSHPQRALSGLNGNNKPPVRTKEPQKGLSRKQGGKIRRTVRVLHYLSPTSKLTFLTLTYGKNYPTDLVAKKHLDNLFKRLKRALKVKHLHYVWIAEKQKRGAIHYHVVLVDYIKRDIIFDAWNGIVQKWQKKEGFEIQEVYPNIQGIRETHKMERYLTKKFNKIGGYLTKEGNENEIQLIYGNIWNRSTITQAACKAQKDIYESYSYEDVKEQFEDIAYQYETDETKEVFNHRIEDTNIEILLIKPKDSLYPMGKNNCTKEDVKEWKKQVEKYSKLE